MFGAWALDKLDEERRTDRAEGSAAVELTFWNIAEVLTHTFPEHRDQIAALARELSQIQARPYPHQFLEAYLLPHLAAVRPNQSPDAHDRAVRLLEQLLSDGDEDLVSATLLNVIEPLVATPATLRQVERDLGPVTSHWIKEVRYRNGAELAVAPEPAPPN